MSSSTAKLIFHVNKIEARYLLARMGIFPALAIGKLPIKTKRRRIEFPPHCQISIYAFSG